MCSVALVLTAISAIVGTTVSVAQAKSQEDFAQYNAKMAGYAAEDIEARGRVEEENHRRRVASFLAKQRAVAASSGLVVDIGSPLDTLEDTAYQGEIEALTLRSNTARAAWVRRSQQEGFRAEASAARTSMYYAVGTGLLGSVASIGGAGYDQGWWGQDPEPLAQSSDSMTVTGGGGYRGAY